MRRRRHLNLPPGMEYDDLPVWMLDTRRGIDWPFLFVIILCVLIAWPLLSHESVPYTLAYRQMTDRTIEMTESLQTGVLYPRWAPNFNYGYGSPIWNYLAPLPHYVSSLHRVLVEATPTASVKSVILFGVILNSISLFSYARRRWNTYAGLLSSILLVLSPQLALNSIYLEGDVARIWATGSFFMALWSFDRLLRAYWRWDFLISVTAFVMMLTSHVPLNGLLLVLFSGWLLWRLVVVRDAPIGRWRYAIAAVALGIGAASFYWLPAMAEFRYVKWWPVPANRLGTDAPISLAALLAYPEPLDMSAANPAALQTLGPLIWLGAIGGLFFQWAWRWRSTPSFPGSAPRGDALQWRITHLINHLPASQIETIYFTIVTIGLVILANPLGEDVWAQQPVWPSLCTQDILLLLTGLVAVLAAPIGTAFESIRGLYIRSAAWCALLLAVGFYAVPYLTRPDGPSVERGRDTIDVLRDELRGYHAASQTTGWLAPDTVFKLPEPSLSLVTSYENRLIDKVQRVGLPAVRVEIVEHTPRRDRLLLEAPDTIDSVEVTLHTYNFPGWRVVVNGQEVKTDPNAPFVTFEVKGGRNEVNVVFGTTFVRSGAWIITFLAGMLAVVVASRMKSGIDSGHSLSLKYGGSLDLLPGLVVIVLVVALGPAWSADRFHQRSSPGFVLISETPYALALQGVDFLGYDMERKELDPNDAFHITLYWRAFQPDLADYQVNVWLESVADDSRQYPLVRRRHPGLIPSSEWFRWPLLETYFRDPYYLKLPNSLPTGNYRVVVQLGVCSQRNLFPCDEVNPLFVRDQRGTSLGQQITLPDTLRVR